MVRRTAAGAAPQAAGDKHHVRAVDGVPDFILALLRRTQSNLGIHPRSQTARDRLADGQSYVRLGVMQRLRVSVDRDVFHPLYARIHHAIQDAVATPSDPHHFDLRERLDVRFDLSHILLNTFIAHCPPP